MMILNLTIPLRPHLPAALLCAFLFPASLPAFDWPMWRADAGRTAAVQGDIAVPLRIGWRTQCIPPTQAWEDPLNQDLMQFDRILEPVAAHGRLFLGSSTADCLQAYSLNNGQLLWTFFADGPIRLTPALWEDLVFFTSDDGFLYCLRQEDGSLVWKHQGVPRDRLLLGNSRLISTWPARGGPVVGEDGTVYYAAGIWPFMGIFIHALDARTGTVRWTNDGSGDMYILQPHNSPAFSGVAPQGNLVLVGETLLVPGGRSVAAAYHAKDGRFAYYHLAENQRRGGAFVCGKGGIFLNYVRDGMTDLFALQNGAAILRDFGRLPVLGDHAILSADRTITAFAPQSLRQEEIVTEKDGEKSVKRVWTIDRMWESQQGAQGDLIMVGRRAFGAQGKKVFSLDLGPNATRPKLDWSIELPNQVVRLIAASGKLIAVTHSSEIYGLLPTTDPVQPRHEPRPSADAEPMSDQVAALARTIAEAHRNTERYGLLYPPCPDGLPDALAEMTTTHWIVFEPDPTRAEALRKRWTDSGLYGRRISLVQRGLPDLHTAPYLAAVSVLPEPPEETAQLLGVWERVRPYGGRLFFPAEAAERITRALDTDAQAQFSAADSVGWQELRREGALPGAANWTHQYGDPANTVKSDDLRVRLPLGLLWFGGSSNLDVLPRHGHGPPEQIVGGRLFIQGLDCLSARDVYTGQVIWKRELPKLDTYGVYYDHTYKDTPLSMAYNQVHIPGANARGTNFVVCEDRVYIIHGDACLVLEPATGADVAEINLPLPEQERPVWGYLGVQDDILVAGFGGVRYSDYLKSASDNSIDSDKDLDATSSRSIVAFNRYTGAVLWTFHSRLGFRHNAIALGGDRLFCVDALPGPVQDVLERRGRTPSGTPTLYSLDLKTGRPVWVEDGRAFGTWLGYSEEFDILLESGRKSRDTVFDELNSGMNAYRASDGSHLWSSDASYGGPLILHHDRIISDRYAFSLLNGQRLNRLDPITGEEQPWAFHRQYGCNYAIASEYLMTFRSAAAGFFNLENDGGTGNFGGFKSGCTSNLIAADGVLNAPDYTRTCSCSYQNQTSLAMVHMPELDYWVTYTGGIGAGTIRELGVNFGAPGHRRDQEDRLWIAVPNVPYLSSSNKDTGLSDQVAVKTQGGRPFTRHPFNLPDEYAENWILASGLEGVESIRIPINTESPVQCEVRILFCKPDLTELERYQFSVEIEGEPATDSKPDIDLSADWTPSELAWSGVIQDGHLDLKLKATHPQTRTIINGLYLSTHAMIPEGD